MTGPEYLNFSFTGWSFSSGAGITTPIRSSPRRDKIAAANGLILDELRRRAVNLHLAELEIA